MLCGRVLVTVWPVRTCNGPFFPMHVDGRHPRPESGLAVVHQCAHAHVFSQGLRGSTSSLASPSVAANTSVLGSASLASLWLSLQLRVWQTFWLHLIDQRTNSVGSSEYLKSAKMWWMFLKCWDSVGCMTNCDSFCPYNPLEGWLYHKWGGQAPWS